MKKPMTTELNKPGTYEFHSGAFHLLDETIEAANKYKETKIQEMSKSLQPNKDLPTSCINDFADLIAMYLTSGEVVPGDFIKCFVVALEDELKVQQHTCDSLSNILRLLKNE
jgi:hypothetical protein